MQRHLVSGAVGVISGRKRMRSEPIPHSDGRALVFEPVLAHEDGMGAPREVAARPGEIGDEGTRLP
jgi:hypothetical protein